MSYFSEALDAHMTANDLTNAFMGERTGLSHTEFSRWRRGVAQPTDKGMARLLPSLPTDIAIKLCICWLKDETPEEMREKILIQPVRIEDVPDLTREDWQQALEFFTRGCEHNPLLRQTLVGLHKLMTENEAEDSAAARHDLPLAADREVSYGGGGDAGVDEADGESEDETDRHLDAAARAYVAGQKRRKAGTPPKA